MATAAYDARAVANFILDLAEDDDTALTQLSLLKIIYFAHGWYLVKTGRPLISHPIEAWKYGPVIKVVRDAFKASGGNTIKTRAERLDIKTGEVKEVEPDLTEPDCQFVAAVYESYKHYEAWALSEMTHEAGSPWHKVWHAQAAAGSLGLRIRNEDIRRHFLELPQRFVTQ